MVEAAIEKLFTKYHAVMPEHFNQILLDLDVSKVHLTRCIGRLKNVGLIFNGPAHYRVQTDNPVKHWSMCVYTPKDQEDAERHKKALQVKGYSQGTGSVPLLFEWVESGGSIAHAEPCNTARWIVAYEHHMAGKADQQEEQSTDCLSGGKAPDHLQ